MRLDGEHLIDLLQYLGANGVRSASDAEGNVTVEGCGGTDRFTSEWATARGLGERAVRQFLDGQGCDCSVLHGAGDRLLLLRVN